MQMQVWAVKRSESWLFVRRSLQMAANMFRLLQYLTERRQLLFLFVVSKDSHKISKQNTVNFNHQILYNLSKYSYRGTLVSVGESRILFKWRQNAPLPAAYWFPPHRGILRCGTMQQPQALLEKNDFLFALESTENPLSFDGVFHFCPL